MFGLQDVQICLETRLQVFAAEKPRSQLPMYSSIDSPPCQVPERTENTGEGVLQDWDFENQASKGCFLFFLFHSSPDKCEY